METMAVVLWELASVADMAEAALSVESSGAAIVEAAVAVAALEPAEASAVPLSPARRMR